jgi:putative transcriptional regulator
MGGHPMNTHPTKMWGHVGENDKEPYRYTGCGLDDVYLISGYDREYTPHGEGVHIRNLEQLHKAIGLHLVTERKVLKGKELRFLRQQMGLTQSDLARFLGCNAQQVARYEKDQNEVTGPADRVIRLLYKDHVGHKRIKIRALLNCLDRMDDNLGGRIFFTQVDGGWKKTVYACA